MRDWRNRLVIQFWGQSLDAILAFAQEKNVTNWEAARMLICAGAGIEYVRPPRGRLPKGQRRRPALLRRNLPPEELHALRVSLGKRRWGVDHVPISAEEKRRRARARYARKMAAKAAAEGRAYEYRPFGTPEHAAKTAAIDEIERLLRTLRNPPRYIRHAAVDLAREGARRGLTPQEAFERSAAFKQERRARLLAQLPEKLRTETRWKLVLSELAAGKTEAEAVAAAAALRVGREKDPEKQRLLALLPPDMRAPYRYVRLKKALAAGKSEAEAVEAATRGRADAFRVAQAKSCALRHEQMLARFAAVVPESFRARYAGRESEVMKQWSKRAKKHGMAFADYVAALFEAKAADPDGNPRVVENLTPARLAALEAGNEKRLAMARERREEEKRERAEKRKLVEMLPVGFRSAAARREIVERVLVEKQEAESAVESIVANGRHGSGRRNAATHPWHAAVRPAASAAAPAKKRPPANALAKEPAPAQERTTSRWRNCATCAHAGLHACRIWPALRAAANLVCPHYASDRAAPSAREQNEGFEEFF